MFLRYTGCYVTSVKSAILICPKCGSTRIKRKDKSGYYCQGCERIRKRAYFKTLAGKAARNRASRKYASTEKGKAAKRRYHVKSLKDSSKRFKRHAQKAVYKAIKFGRLERLC